MFRPIENFAIYGDSTAVNLNNCILALYSRVVTICNTRFNIQKFHILPTKHNYVFCIELRPNGDYSHIYGVK